MPRHISDPLDRLRDALALIYEAVAETCGLPSREQFETTGHETEAVVAAIHRAFRERVTTFQFQIEIWSPDGVHLIEVIGGLNHAGVAEAAYEATLKERPTDRVMLRQGIRVVQERVPTAAQ